MEDSLVKIAIRHILVTLAWVGLLLGHRVSAQDWVTSNTPPASSAYEVIPRGSSGTAAEGSDSSVIGEHQVPIGGIFGDTPPAACEFCGGGGCLPPTWTFESSVGVIAVSRANNNELGTDSLPGGPLSAGSITVTNSNGITTSNNFTQYLNDVAKSSLLEVHTMNPSVSPSLGIGIKRFLGRDGEGRDHFLEFAFNGLQRYSASQSVQGSTVPFYDTTPFAQAIPAAPPNVLLFDGSLVSPFPIYLPLNGNQSPLAAPLFSILGQNYDKAFNRSDRMSASYVTSYNEWELNYRFAGHNQPDQLVMNPNGHWYRQCQTGYYYSYFFGMKSMVIDESFDYSSSGSQFAAINNGNGTFSQGALQYTHQGSYSVKTYNTLLGFQSGGKLEYRFCRWLLDTHGNAGMYLDIAHQDSRIQTSFGGPTPPQLSDGSTAGATDNSFGASNNGVAFAGGFGVAGSYKFRPNIVGRLSYDMTWVGDVARAPEQMVFSSVPENARENVLNTKGTVFYDGVSFQLEMDW
jgi:hypothetical protein